MEHIVQSEAQSVTGWPPTPPGGFTAVGLFSLLCDKPTVSHSSPITGNRDRALLRQGDGVGAGTVLGPQFMV